MARCATCGHVSAEPFKFCPECGAGARAAAREERKIVTVVFCDVVGSTDLGERLDPESLRHVLARYFDTVRAVVERHGGIVEKFIGDAVMAVFGIPVLHEDDALRGVRAAADMLTAMEPLNDELAREYGATLALRIGVNTGEVVTGTEERLATGDAVNVAARLEQHAGPREVLIGGETFARVRGAVDVEPLPPLEVKGKSGRIRAWRLRDVRPVGARHLSASPMIGRRHEVGRLHDAFATAVAGPSCRLVTVVGEAGVGKSRLVSEFLAGVAGARVVQARCLPYGEGITYWPVAEIVRQLEHDLPRFALGSRAERALAGLLGAGGASSTEEIAWAVRKLLEAAAGEQPVVCVLDDANWGEETFLDLVEQVAALTSGVALLVLCMGRPDILDRRPGWGARANADSIFLEPLSDDEAELLIEELVGETPLAEPLRERIRDTAAGNPLFVEEMIAMLREAGTDALPVPATIHALLASRLDQLEPAERVVLQCGAVEGRVFHDGVLQALAPERIQLGTALAALVRKDLIRPHADHLFPGDTYRFRHVLIRDAAYEALPKSERAELHERLVRWLEEHSVSSEPEEVLAYHLESALRYRRELAPGSPGWRPLAARAGGLLESAGRHALARLDVGAARSLLERALALRPEDDPAVALRLDLAEVLFLAGEPDAVDLADSAAARAGAAGDEAGRLRARLMTARIAALTPGAGAAGDDPSGALLELAAAARPVFAASGDDVALTEAWVGTAWAELIRCRYGAMFEAVEHALEHASRARYVRWLRELPVWKGTALFYGPAPVGEVLQWHEEEQPLHALALRQHGILEAMQGRFEEGRALLARGDAAAAELGQTIWIAVGGMARWEVETLAGDHGAAEQAARESCERLEAIGDTGYRATATVELAQSVFEQGRLVDAEREAGLAAALAAPDDRVSQALWRQVAGTLEAASGREAHAERLAREAVALLDETDMHDHRGRARADLARVLRATGDTDAAADELERAASLFDRKEDLVRAEQARAALLEFRSPRE